ncbi:sensor histidine kinase [Sphingobacterium tabacisoli]|uniref:Sensor histidine kinase n=1 Tax=Sphingobacterium tabacisoli TaxID=2044855 RepID=A0ABW5L6U4_9SPHI|nr:histidine kinase [Sphingobacterium tabacisoli]
MITERLRHFNALFCLLWLIITTVIWTVSDYQQHDLFSKTISVMVPLGALILSTYILCNLLLPQAVGKNRGYWTVLVLVSMALVQGVLLYLCEELLFFLGQSGVIVLDTEPRDTFWVSIINATPIALLLNLGFGGLRFFYEHAKLSEKHHVLQKSLLESQVAALQAQINPHFMFNVLNHIHILMQRNVDKSSTLLLKYADMLRYQLYEGNKDSTYLKTEIAFINNFIEIEQIRWDNRLIIDTCWNIGDAQTRISPLLFFTLLENAFKFVSRPEDGKGFVKVKMDQEEECIVFFVENSVSGSNLVDKNEGNSGLGLSNLRKRLDLLYAERYKLDIVHTAEWYSATLLIYV